MDKDLEEIQNFANYLNRKPEERPFKRSIETKNEMFSSGTKKIKSKMQVQYSLAKTVLNRLATTLQVQTTRFLQAELQNFQARFLLMILL